MTTPAKHPIRSLLKSALLMAVEGGKEEVVKGALATIGTPVTSIGRFREGRRTILAGKLGDVGRSQGKTWKEDQTGSHFCSQSANRRDRSEPGCEPETVTCRATTATESRPLGSDCTGGFGSGAPVKLQEQANR